MRAKILIAYVSGGGNTKEVAEVISATLTGIGKEHDIFRVGSNATLPNLSEYDLLYLGSYTIGEGRTPKTMVDFLRNVGVKHSNVAVFGTGDTQWTQYCGAADRLAKFHKSKYPVLKIEQSPRGEEGKESQQEIKIKEWTTEVIKKWLKTAWHKNLRNS